MADYMNQMALGQGLQLDTSKLAGTGIDPWGLMAMVDQSPSMQASFGAPAAPNMGPQQPGAGAQPGFGQLLGMMGGNPGIFAPQRFQPQGARIALGHGGAPAQYHPALPVGAPGMQPGGLPTLGMLLGRR